MGLCSYQVYVADIIPVFCSVFSFLAIHVLKSLLIKSNSYTLSTFLSQSSEKIKLTYQIKEIKKHKVSIMCMKIIVQPGTQRRNGVEIFLSGCFDAHLMLNDYAPS